MKMHVNRKSLAVYANALRGVMPPPPRELRRTTCATWKNPDASAAAVDQHALRTRPSWAISGIH